MGEKGNTLPYAFKPQPHPQIRVKLLKGDPCVDFLTLFVEASESVLRLRLRFRRHLVVREADCERHMFNININFFFQETL